MYISVLNCPINTCPYTKYDIRNTKYGIRGAATRFGVSTIMFVKMFATRFVLKGQLRKCVLRTIKDRYIHI